MELISRPIGVPNFVVGIGRFDGSGGFTQIDYPADGLLNTPPLTDFRTGQTGTYAVRADCTGTQVINLNVGGMGALGGVIHNVFVISNGGRSIHGVVAGASPPGSTQLAPGKNLCRFLEGRVGARKLIRLIRARVRGDRSAQSCVGEVVEAGCRAAPSSTVWHGARDALRKRKFAPDSLLEQRRFELMVPPRTPAFRGRHMGPALLPVSESRPPEKRQRSAELSATASAVATPFHVGVPNAHTPIALSSIVRIASIVTGSFRLSSMRRTRMGLHDGNWT